jgi:hypothetical protein
MATELLTGHVSPETAFVVDDYPYGFRLRCKIRYWLEFKPKHGFRFVSQTTNPKRAGEVWNKPKAGTYVKLAAVMIRDSESGHVAWISVNEFDELETVQKFMDDYGHAMPTNALEGLHDYINRKKIYEKLKAEGKDWQIAGMIAARVKYTIGEDGEPVLTKKSMD